MFSKRCIFNRKLALNGRSCLLIDFSDDNFPLTVHLLKNKKSAPLSFISNMVRSWLPSYANWATLRKKSAALEPLMGNRWWRKRIYSPSAPLLRCAKQVAVEYYLNHGCCLAFTSRTLGYPCSDVLVY